MRGAPSSKRDGRRAGSVSPLEVQSLRNPADFRRVLRNGTRHQRGALVLIRLPGRSGPPRLGLVVPKGVGNAVTRNRIKRRLRHAVRELHLEPGTDYVIIARRRIADVAFEKIVHWLSGALDEARDA